MSQSKYKVVTTTVDKKARATRLAAALVKTRLTACVQFWPIQSLYHWKGKIESGSEYLLACKAPARCVVPLLAYIREHHPYETPEIIVTSIETGHPAYLAWLDTETTAPRLTFPALATRKSSSRNKKKA